MSMCTTYFIICTIFFLVLTNKHKVSNNDNDDDDDCHEMSIFLKHSMGSTFLLISFFFHNIQFHFCSVYTIFVAGLMTKK